MNIIKNNKGLTITEIIISISLVSIVLIFLFNALITIKNTNQNTSKSSTELINQALITRSIQNDFNSYELENVYACEQREISSSQGLERIFPNIPTNIDKLYCLKFVYNKDLVKEKTGYLLYYSYKYSNDETINVVGYKRGYYQIMRETSITPDSTKTPGTISNNNCEVTDSFCTLTIKLPIIDEEGNDYSIYLNYIYNLEGRFEDNIPIENQSNNVRIFTPASYYKYGFPVSGIPV